MKTLYRIEPIGHERLWGGNLLAREFHLSDTGSIGEVSCVSAHPACDCQVADEGCTLSEFYKAHPDFFHLSCQDFPLRVNVMDAQDDLSIQVHPGKSTHTQAQPEAWYVVDSVNASLYLGHHWRTKAELIQAAEKNLIQRDVIRLPSHTGDFYYLKPGTVHAVGKGNFIYELTRQADITYRLYDYHRTDKQGKPRTLHIEQAAECIYYPQILSSQQPLSYIQSEACSIFVYIDKPQVFTLMKIELHGTVKLQHSDFYVYTVLQGSGTMNGKAITKWESILQICESEVCITGNMTLMAATYREE